MKRVAILLFGLLLLVHLKGFAQDLKSASLHGRLCDTLNNTFLQHGSVSLIRARDSILVKFTRTDSLGNFSISTDSPGRYILMATYPGFADYIDGIDLKAGQPQQLGKVPLVSTTHLLKEFVITKKAAAVVIKGDTTEYNADSFLVREGASVEDLLKKLPGIQVDKDGKITAQGEQVQKVLVDGEEFFSDDPAVVTKGLQSAAVDKVQVFDKKSDEATFTGIDDGEKTKTINLQLKEDKKKGVFGKAIAGGGSDGYFENQAMINAFKGKRQLSAFGIMSNTGTVGLGWQDRDRFGSGNTRSYDEESGSMYTYSSSDDDDLSGSWNSQYNGEGLPTVWTGGIHYADKWNKDKQHVSTNYRYSKNNIETEAGTTTQYILPDSGYTQNQKRSSFSSAQRHGGDGMYEWTIDTTSNLRLTASGGYIERVNNGASYTETHGASGGLINNSKRITNNSSNSETLNAQLNYRKKFKKKGRNFSINVDETFRRSEGEGTLVSANTYFTDGQDTTMDGVDQLKTANTSNFRIGGTVSYTEPLSKSTFLTVRYGATVTDNTSDRFSYNRNGSGYDDIPDSVYSSSYDYDVLTHNGNVTLRYVQKKYTISIGADGFHTDWRQVDLLRNTNRTRNFDNYAPSASIKYNFSKQSNLSFRYYGNTQQPTIDQIQPLAQNQDPLNIAIGNPDLHQEFDNTFSLNFHNYKPLSGFWSYLGGYAVFISDDITRSDFTDAQGRRSYKYINVDGNYNSSFWGGFGTKWKKPDIHVNLNGNFGFSRQLTYVNSVANESKNNNYSASINLSKDWEKDDKSFLELSINPGVSYNDNRSSISDYSTSFWSASLELNAYLRLPYKFELRSDLEYNYREQTDVFNTNNNVVRWNASASRKFLKKEQLELRFSVHDILNQNLGYNRSAQNGYITENRYNTIQRYGMISLTWLFAKGPNAQLPTSNDDD